MTTKYLIPPASPPDLHIPPSTSTVRISCIDTTAHISLPTEHILTPTYSSHRLYSGPSYSFLIHHPSGSLLFDLGVRKEHSTLPPSVQSSFRKYSMHADVKSDLPSILSNGGVDPHSIREVIWSHQHWDHIGAFSQFPPSTPLLVGPGFLERYGPGHPIDSEGVVPSTDLLGPNVKEITSFPLRVGRFEACDYFGDGSFYILHVPGHSVGHLCALARTGEGEFVFLAADAAHHGGEFRPSKFRPLRDDEEGRKAKGWQRNGRADETFVDAVGAEDEETSRWSIEGLQEFDADDRVLVMLAHDATLEGEVEMFPRMMNGWRKEGVGEKVRWKFLRDFKGGVVKT